MERRDAVIGGLRGEVDRLHRAEVERIAEAEGMAVPGDLWTIGTGLAELRDDDGRLDADKARETIRTTLETRPRWRRELPDLGSGPRATSPANPPGLSKLLGKR